MGQKLMIKLSHIKLAAIKTKYSSVILSELIINNGRPNQMSNNFPLWWIVVLLLCDLKLDDCIIITSYNNINFHTWNEKREIWWQLPNCCINQM